MPSAGSGVTPQLLADLHASEWRVRLAAVQQLQAAARSTCDRLELLPDLSAIIHRLNALLADTAPQLPPAALQALADLITAVQNDIRPYLGDVLRGLTVALGSNSPGVGQAAMRAVAALTSAVGGSLVVGHVLAGSPHTPSCSIREGNINAITQALLQHPQEQFEWATLVRGLLGSSRDSEAGVREAAAEALTVVRFCLGPARMMPLLAAAGADAAALALLAQRFASPALPTLAADGSLQLQQVVQPQQLSWELGPKCRAARMSGQHRLRSSNSAGRRSTASERDAAANGHDSTGGRAASAAQMTYWGATYLDMDVVGFVAPTAPRNPSREDQAKLQWNSPPAVAPQHAVLKTVAGNSSAASPAVPQQQPGHRHESLQWIKVRGRPAPRARPASAATTTASLPVSPTRLSYTSAKAWTAPAPLQSPAEPLTWNGTQGGAMSDGGWSIPAIRTDINGLSGMPAGAALSPHSSPTKTTQRLQTLKHRVQEARRAMSASATLQRPVATGSPFSGCGSDSFDQALQTASSSKASLAEVFGEDPYASSPPTPGSWAQQDSTLNDVGARCISPTWAGSTQARRDDLTAAPAPTGSPSSMDSPFSVPASALATSLQAAEEDGSAAAQPLLQRCADPAATLQAVMQALATANAAKRKELDWRSQQQALRQARCLVRFHVDAAMPQLHALVQAALPAVQALRSTTARECMQLFQDVFQVLRAGMGAEVDIIAPVLLQRAGEVSLAGRDTFLATEADATLAAMVDYASEGRVAAALLSCAHHKSTHVRAKMLRHLDACTQGGHGLRLAAVPGMLERVLRCGVAALEDGSQDARTHGKRIIWAARSLADCQSPAEFNRMLARLPQDGKQQQKALEVLATGSGPPPLPARSLALGSLRGSPAESRPGTPPVRLSSAPGLSTRANSGATLELLTGAAGGSHPSNPPGTQVLLHAHAKAAAAGRW